MAQKNSCKVKRKKYTKDKFVTKLFTENLDLGPIPLKDSTIGFFINRI
jgi:hypothetical protein